MKPWVDNSSIALDHFPITASYLLCEVFAKKYNYFPDTINKTSSLFKVNCMKSIEIKHFQ